MKRFASERLRDARVSLGMTQEEAASALGVDVRTYRRYESGAVNEGGGLSIRHASRRQLLDRMAKELGLDESELVIEDSSPAPAPGPHVLPPVARFVGRDALIESLAAWRSNVAALVAMGGAGKTSVAGRVVDRTPGAFVWSFYQDASPASLFAALAERFGGSGAGGAIDRVESALARAPGARLVLDGLEVLQGRGSSDRARGELEDPALARLLRSLAAGLGSTKLLVLSRLPPVDLAPWEGRGYMRVELPPLSEGESRALLESYGVAGTRELLERGAGHALSLALIGSYSSTHGELMVELAEAAGDEPLARRLFGILRAYARELPALEREVLGLLSVLGTGARLEAVARSSSAPVEALARALRRLVALGLAHATASAGYGLHPFVAELGRELVPDARAILEAERQELLRTAGASPDGIERLIMCSIGAGRAGEAFVLYQRALGGFARLGLELGEMIRGARITRALSGAAIEGDARALVEYDRGLYAGALGDLGLALASYARAQRWAREAGDASWQTTVLRTTAYTHRLAGDLDLARGSADGAIQIADSRGLRSHLARDYALRGAIETTAGAHCEAARWFAAARELDPAPFARRSLWECEHWIAMGELDRALEQTRCNLEVCRARSWPGHVAHCHVVLGTIAGLRGEPEQAREHLAAVRAWTDRTGEIEMILRACILADACGDAAEGARGRALAARLGFRSLA